MFGSIKFRWFLLVPLLLAILFAFGCVYASSTIGYLTAKEISYTPEDQGIEPWFREAGPKIFVSEFDNKSGSSWFNFVPRHWIGIPLSKLGPRTVRSVQYCGPLYVFVNCPQLFKNVFTKEFQALGLQVVENANEAQVIMKGKIDTFSYSREKPPFPHGKSYVNSRVLVSLVFVDQSGNVLFQTKLSASATDQNSLNLVKAVSGLNTQGDKKATRINKLIHALLSQVHDVYDFTSDTSDEIHIFHNRRINPIKVYQGKDSFKYSIKNFFLKRFAEKPKQASGQP